MKKLARAFIVSSLIAYNTGAISGGAASGGATEVTQILNNVELAAATIEQQYQTIEAIFQSRLAELENLAARYGQYSSQFQRAQQAYQRFADFTSTVRDLQYNAENVESMLNHRFQQFAASDLNWNSWVQRERDAIESGDERARGLIKANRDVMSGMQQSIDAYRAAQESMSSSLGMNQAIGVLNAQVNTLGSDMTKLLMTTNLELDTRMMERQEAAARRSSAVTDMEKIDRERKAAQEENRRMINRIN